ncbi:TPA: ammonium transporter, partial [Klebsiella pneumoniae]|nr:ammonium transporter [Klebsiella pneumoniae]
MEHALVNYLSLDVPNTAFMLLCASLVMLMTPGLAFFYGGLVPRKSIVTIMAQSFFSMGWVAALWFIVGYSLSFGPTLNGIIGDPLYYSFMNNIDPGTMYTDNKGGIPLLVHFVYQMMFAIITPALITGAFANRVNFPAYLVFLTFWTLLVYCPFVHMIWSPQGMLAKWGVVDFAGGIVVHATAGFAALASALYVGKRTVASDGTHNIPYIALGAGLLWFGWY